MEDGFRRLSRGYRNEGNGPVSLFTPVLSLKITNRKEGFILKEGDIHRHEILLSRRMVTLIAPLVQWIHHENT